MATTVNGFPYPVPSDSPDVPRDIKALAEKTDHENARKAGRLGIGVARVVKSTSVASGGQCQVLLTGIKAGTVPFVVATLNAQFAWILNQGEIAADHVNFFVLQPNGSPLPDGTQVTITVVVIGEMDPAVVGPPQIS